MAGEAARRPAVPARAGNPELDTSPPCLQGCRTGRRLHRYVNQGRASLPRWIGASPDLASQPQGRDLVCAESWEGDQERTRALGSSSNSSATPLARGPAGPGQSPHPRLHQRDEKCARPPSAHWSEALMNSADVGSLPGAPGPSLPHAAWAPRETPAEGGEDGRVRAGMCPGHLTQGLLQKNPVFHVQGAHRNVLGYFKWILPLPHFFFCIKIYVI